MRAIQVWVVALLLVVAQVADAATPLPPPGGYLLKIRWSGFHVASLIVGWHTRKDGVTEMQAAIRTYGLAKTVSRYHSDSKSLSKDGIPIEFRTQFVHRKGEREIKLKWNNFMLISEYDMPPEKPGKRTPVSAKQKEKAYDPLTAFFAARAMLMAGKKKFILPMYDGRRRSELQFQVLEKRPNGKLHVAMKEIFLAGYTKREQEERSKRDITIHMDLDPKTYIPVGGVAQSILGTATAELGATCKTYQQCMER